MFSGTLHHARALVTAIAVLTGGAILPGGTAAADPSQDDKFLTLLGYEDIPSVDNTASLIATANKICVKLDGGMPVGDLVELIRNNGFNENPLARLYPQRRVTATINRFINAAVQAYCPYDEGKIASVTGQAARESTESTRGVAMYTRSTINSAAWQQTAGKPDADGTVLAAVIGTVPSGEVPPSNPPPIPEQPPSAPQEVAPAPRQSPPPPERVHPVPRQAEPPQQQAEPPQQQAEPPQDAEPPAAGPQPGGGDSGGPPANPPPEQPSPPEPPMPPGHVRLAP
jgi:Protein of unknown function (DUF732)